MKEEKIKSLLWLFVVMLGCLPVSAQNVLRVADFTQAAGKVASVPIYLDNSQDVVGLQFDITLPYAKNGNVTLEDARINGHSISARKLSNTKYTVVVMSMENRPLRGNAGLLIRFPISVPTDAQADDTKTVMLDNIVLTSRTGQNIATELTSEATFTVLRTPTPDFVLTELTIANDGETLTPGGQLRLSFNVENQGTGDAVNGWNEKIYLEDETGFRSFVTTQAFKQPLPAGESVPRSYEVTLPQVLKTSGTVRAYINVEAKKSTDELIADQGNNGLASSNTKELAKRLFLSSSRIEIKEGKSASITLTRSGDWSMAETFTLAESNDENVSQLSFPETVTIKSKQSAVSFKVTATNNDAVNTVYRSTLTVADTDTEGYQPVQMYVDVDDDDSNLLTLTTDKFIYDEGDDLTFTATISQVQESDLTVNLSNTAANRFYPFVRTIIIPAGSLTAKATTKVVDDDYPMADLQVTFTAQAQGFSTSKQIVTLRDNDRPQLSITFSRTIISEGDGYGATMATISRTGNSTQNVTIYLNHNAGKELFFDSQYVIIPAGQTSVTVPVSVEDNSQIDGQRTWTITAAACDASTGKPFAAGSTAYATASLTVTDDDAEGVLKLQCNVATLLENGSGATVTVERNGTVGDLIVNLSSDVSYLELPATVTIKNGQKKATFTVKAKNNTSADENYYARVTASAQDYQSAQFVFLISMKPDAVCAAPVVSNDRPYGGQTIHVTLAVTNQGTQSMPGGMEVRLFLKESKSGSSKSEVYKGTLSQTVAVGKTVEMACDIVMPMYQKEQEYYLMATLNPQQVIVESNYNNNSSATTPIYIVPSFTLANIATDKSVYTRGQTVHITGQMTNSGSQLPMDGCQVDAYLLNNDKRYQVTTTLDANGRFAADYTFGEQTGGRYLVGACVHGTGGTQTMARINVTRLKIERSNYLKQDITEGVPLEGDIAVTNLSEEPLKNIRFQFTGLPADWTVEWTKIGTLQGGATGNAHYRIVATEPTSAKKLVEGTFIASAYDDNGEQIAGSEMPVYFWWYAATAKLMTDGDIKTTLYKLGQRTYQLRVQNSGLKETGTINVEWPSASPWLSASSATMPSIPAGGSQTLTLNLKGQENMIIDGVYESSIRLSCPNGKPLVQKVKVTAVSTDRGTLSVDVVDAYTLADENVDGPHVSGASVRVTNAFTGEVAITGTTGEDGIFRAENLKEGTYYVYATAPNHYYSEKTITVAPGTDNPLQMFLAYETVRITYTVERTTVTDEYQTVLSMDIVPDIPQAIVVPTLPSNWGTGQKSFSVRLTNKGRLTAYTPYLEFPNVKGVTFTVKSEYPAVIYPNESYDVTVEFNSPEDASYATLGYIVMHYAYKMRGETYWSQEKYLALMGRGDVTFLAGGGLPTVSGDSEGRNFGTYTPPASWGGDQPLNGGNDNWVPDVSEPEVEVRDYTKSIDNRVRLQFEQKFFLEREAFKGTLTIENLTMHSIEHIDMVPWVKDMAGEDASGLFSITTEGVADNWALASSQTGTATVLYVPSKETAPTEPVKYLFGGTVTYRDVESGQMVIVDLTPTELTVNPSPDLHLMYFVQRDFISDDPTTPEVEPWEPVQFALLIQNRGAGEALGLRIETSEPTIVDNKNNLPVTFTQLYCTVDGQEGHLNFNKLNLDRVAPGQSIMGRWWFYSNVSAHVANYDVRMTKHSNYGMEFDLITLDGVRELTHSVGGSLNRQDEAGTRRQNSKAENSTPATVFLLNTIEDEDNLPDHLMDSEGNESDDLQIVSEAMTTTPATASTYTLTVTADHEGWVYGRVQDPTNCAMTLVKAVRQSDGQDVTANLWQTDRTVQADYTTIVDNRLHLADRIGVPSGSTAETYTLYYEPKPAAAPAVKSIALMDHDGNVIADPGVNPQTMTRARITFADAVEASTVDASDVVLIVGGKELGVNVERESQTAFIVDWSKSLYTDGLATLTVFTSGIQNAEGTAGTTNKSLTWLAKAVYKKGDVNIDGAIDVADIATIISVMAGTDTAQGNADVNGDGVIDVADIANTIDIMAANSRRDKMMANDNEDGSNM